MRAGYSLQEMAAERAEQATRAKRWPLWWLCLALGVALSAFTLAWLGVLGLPIGVPGQWVVERVAHPPPARRGLVPLALVLALGGVMFLCARGLRRPGARAQRALVLLALCAAVVLAVCLQWTLCDFTVQPPGMLWVVASLYNPVSCEYFETAWRYPRALELTRRYVEVMRYSREEGHFHVATHPPGAVLFYRAAIDILRAMPRVERWLARYIECTTGYSLRAVEAFAHRFPNAALLPRRAVVYAVWCAWLAGALGALAAAPVYLLGARLCGREVGIAAAGIYALVPSQALYFPELDPLLALFAACALAVFVAGVQRRAWALYAAAGAILGLGLFVSFGLLPVFAVAAIYALLCAWATGERRAWREAGASIAWLAGAALAVQLLLAGVFRTQPLAILAFGLGTHRHIAEAFHRQYLPWLGANIVEFGLFFGWPLFALLLWRLVALGGERPGALQNKANALGLAALATLALVDVSGTVRGETGRIWLFFMPPLVVWLVAATADDGRGAGWRLVALGLALALGLITLAAALVPAVRPF